jgi:hypothetical protein
MQYDDLKECTRCGSDACYVQEVTKDIKIELCYGCGFQSNSIIKKDNTFYNEQIETLPELYKELMDEEEETGKIWMPTHINVKDKGTVFAIGSSRNDWAWAGVKAIKDKEKGYKTDISTVKYFKERDFIEALSYIQVIP